MEWSTHAIFDTTFSLLKCKGFFFPALFTLSLNWLVDFPTVYLRALRLSVKRHNCKCPAVIRTLHHQSVTQPVLHTQYRCLCCSTVMLPDIFGAFLTRQFYMPPVWGEIMSQWHHISCLIMMHGMSYSKSDWFWYDFLWVLGVQPGYGFRLCADLLYTITV